VDDCCIVLVLIFFLNNYFVVWMIVVFLWCGIDICGPAAAAQEQTPQS
jgi:hypothetical protein